MSRGQSPSFNDDDLPLSPSPPAGASASPAPPSVPPPSPRPLDPGAPPQVVPRKTSTAGCGWFVAGLVIAGMLGVMGVSSLGVFTFPSSSGSPTDATATAASQRYLQVTSGSPTFADPLTDNSQGNQWAEGTYRYGDCYFAGSAYHVTAKPQDYHSCGAETFPLLSDFAFQVQLTFIQGDGGGFDFRFDNNDGYLFSLQQDGTATVLREDGTQFIPLFQERSPAISTGQGQHNLIGVLAQGQTFAFFVNNQYIASVSDNTYGQGYVEALAASLSGTVADVAFQEAQAWVV